MFKCDFFSLLRLVKSSNNNPFFVICGFLWSPHIQRKPFRQKIINDQTINNFSPFCIFFFVCVSKRNQWKGSVLIKHWLSTYIHRILQGQFGTQCHQHQQYRCYCCRRRCIVADAIVFVSIAYMICVCVCMCKARVINDDASINISV